MDDPRSTILGRIRAALGDTDGHESEPPADEPGADTDRHESEPPAGTPGGAPNPATQARLADQFAETVADYRAAVIRATEGDVAAVLDRELAQLGATRVAIADGLAEAWWPTTPTLRGNQLTTAELTEIDAVVTGARAGIARTGTIVLDHAADQGPRRLTLVPDRHLCVVRAADVVDDVVDAFAALGPAAASSDGPGITFVSGPSATSDIELQRIEGVHGPRTLVVVIVA